MAAGFGVSRAMSMFGARAGEACSPQPSGCCVCRVLGELRVLKTLLGGIGSPGQLLDHGTPWNHGNARRCSHSPCKVSDTKDRLKYLWHKASIPERAVSPFVPTAHGHSSHLSVARGSLSPGSACRHPLPIYSHSKPAFILRGRSGLGL